MTNALHEPGLGPGWQWLRRLSSIPWLVGAVFGVAVLGWLLREPPQSIPLRTPGSDDAPTGGQTARLNPVLGGVRTSTTEPAPDLPGLWPQFRGPERDGTDGLILDRQKDWGALGPRKLWSMDVGEGYAGPAVAKGRVLLMDYDREKQQDALRCLSLATGKEIWRYAYPVAVKRNHGMSRTVPAIESNSVVAIGPKGHVVCCDLQTGALKWGMDLVTEQGATVPPWYTGQCPLIDRGKVILAPGGPAALLLAVDLTTGKAVWNTPNPKSWKMTHSSIMRIEVEGVAQYVYCASGGVVGVAADDGRVLWETSDWKISIAAVPSPVPIPGNRLFFAGGYNAGSLMLQIRQSNGVWLAETLYRLKPEVFGATQHTPVFHGDRLYGIRPDGDLACLDLDGNVKWTTGQLRFGLGPFLMVGDAILALSEGGQLCHLEPGPVECRVLHQARVLEAREAWAPMALAGERLLLRDLTSLVCLELP